MRKGWEFDPDKPGIEDVSRNSREVGELLTRKASEAAGRIENMAPRGFMDYAKNVTVIPARDRGDGQEAAVGVDSPVWHLPEYGTVNYPARAPIRRGVQDAGIRFEDR